MARSALLPTLAVLSPIGAALLLIASACGSYGAEATDANPSPTTDASTTVDADATSTVDSAAPSSVDAGDAGDGSDGGPCLSCERVVFVTSSTFTGNLGGLDAADLLCQSRALASMHPRIKGRKFRAWLSTKAISVVSRLVHGTGAYVRADGKVFAPSFAALLVKNPLLSLELDENASLVADNVWTGTNAGGSTSNATCSDWIVGTDVSTGQAGKSGDTTSGWTDALEDGCAANHHLYCFEE